MTTLLLSAVGGTWGETGVALAADHLVTVVLAGEGLERWLDQTTTETEDQVKSGFLLDVIVRESAAVLQLLSGEDQTLLVGGDALLVLNLGLDIVNGVGRLNLEGDGLAREGFDEDLHFCWSSSLLSGCCRCLEFFAEYAVGIPTLSIRANRFKDHHMTTKTTLHKFHHHSCTFKNCCLLYVNLSVVEDLHECHRRFSFLGQ